jgi:asparagine N-glycosylation enzyme membrane subunit Stt3
MMLMLSILAFWPPQLRTLHQNHHRNLIGLAIALLTITALAVRFFIVREVPVGFFGDSYHHTVITQLLIDHGGLFHSWQPYAPAVTFTYHYTFHTMAAWWHWLSGVSAVQGVILVGQVMNGLAAPLTYLLTARLTNSRLTGLWAAVIGRIPQPLSGILRELGTIYTTSRANRFTGSGSGLDDLT